MSLIKITDVHKTYYLSKNKLDVLKGINLTVNKGEFLALSGPSGSGKTTLLNMMGAIDVPTQGTVEIDQENIGQLDSDALAHLRATKISFIFQNFNLLPVLTALENVEFALFANTITPQERRKRAQAALESVGLGSHAAHKPLELSGGQQQRVAIARAMVRAPLYVLADEPTANLDHKTGEDVIRLMKESCRLQGITYIFSTHDQKVVEQADRVVKMWDGAIIS